MSDQGIDELALTIAQESCAVLEKCLGLHIDNDFISEMFLYVRKVLNDANLKDEIRSLDGRGRTKGGVTDSLALGLYMRAITKGGSNHATGEVIVSLKESMHTTLSSYRRQVLGEEGPK